MNFDQRGLLIPPEKISFEQSQFAQIFVRDFPESSTRGSLFQAYQDYSGWFTQKITGSFVQWIGGSFTTAKRSPQDIDLVTLCAQEDLIKHDEILASETEKGNWKSRGVDAYVVGVRAYDAPDYPLYRSDFVYWIHQFSTTRRDRRGRKHARGFVEITFNGYSYE
ncbi:hypothetical protein GGR26_000051 [Lewinella marina]|uniref:Polymerase nucleotidyl transferase domain-containing protein n=1 Tax=Neolewinella marina TaxID=438751 RepID=A0A2G0CKI5_9BACT|nr:hypothetical protein [Neolewinella marina]NJB84306.1 hypothetical protein [Neolewinella marina]PHL00490.1 hypothetical protein CGL56_05525 [Neolewinella marina]